MTEQVEELLSPEARATLEAQGFVVVPEEFRLFHQAYDEQFYSGTPVFVTTDAAYHAWHQVFDKILRDLETERLAPALGQLLTGMRRERHRAAQGAWPATALADDAARVVDLIAVAAAELGVPSGTLSERALGGEGAHRCPRRTRGHVTHPGHGGRLLALRAARPLHAHEGADALLRGHVGAGPASPSDCPAPFQTDATVVESLDNLRLAVLASRTLVGDPELEALWRQVFEPTAFLVGRLGRLHPLRAHDGLPDRSAPRVGRGRCSARPRRRDALRRRRRAARRRARCGSTRSGRRCA